MVKMALSPTINAVILTRPLLGRCHSALRGRLTGIELMTHTPNLYRPDASDPTEAAGYALPVLLQSCRQEAERKSTIPASRRPMGRRLRLLHASKKRRSCKRRSGLQFPGSALRRTQPDLVGSIHDPCDRCRSTAAFRGAPGSAWCQM